MHAKGTKDLLLVVQQQQHGKVQSSTLIYDHVPQEEFCLFCFVSSLFFMMLFIKIYFLTQAGVFILRSCDTSELRSTNFVTSDGTRIHFIILQIT